MKKILLSLIFSMFCTSVMAQTSISLSPTESYLTGAPGTTVSQEFIIFNDGSAPYVLTCSFDDLWFEGEKTTSGDLGTIKERQAGYNTQCSPNKVMVPPKYAQKIKVVSLIPKDQEGERYTRFFAQMLPPDQAQGNKGVRAMIGYSAKIGATVATTADGTQKKTCDIEDVKIEQTKKFQNLQFKMKNTGNLHFVGSGTLVIMDSGDQMIEKINIEIPFTFPTQTKSLSFNLVDPLKHGKYKALLSITATGKETPFVKEFPIDFSK